MRNSGNQGLKKAPKGTDMTVPWLKAIYRFAFKMDDPAFSRVPRASRGLGYAGLPNGTSSKNRLKGNEGMRLKANRHQYGTGLSESCAG